MSAVGFTCRDQLARLGLLGHWATDQARLGATRSQTSVKAACTGCRKNARVVQLGCVLGR